MVRVTTRTSLPLKINIRALLILQLIAKHYPSVGTYRLSGSVVIWEPASNRRHPSGQHIRALVGGQEQCCCNSKYPIPSILLSSWRHMRLFISNVLIPSSTLVITRDLESLNNLFSVGF